MKRIKHQNDLTQELLMKKQPFGEFAQTTLSKHLMNSKTDVHTPEAKGKRHSAANSILIQNSFIDTYCKLQDINNKMSHVRKSNGSFDKTVNVPNLKK